MTAYFNYAYNTVLAAGISSASVALQSIFEEKIFEK